MNSRGDLQATQRIIDLFENSKEQTESALEALPGIYAVIDRAGSILKGNRQLGHYFEVHHENLLSLNLQRLFQKEDWQIFEKQLDALGSNSESESPMEFQTELMIGTSLRMFWWSLQQISVPGRSDHPIFSAVGRDITDLNRATELNTRMQFELNTAKTVQDTLFPPANAMIGNSEISGFYEPASECGGDWWYYNQVDDKVFLWIGDVTGHGVSAALLTSAVRGAASVLERTSGSPLSQLSALNAIVGSVGAGVRQMTFLIAEINLQTGTCTYVSAAHEPCICFRKNVSQFELLLSEPSIPLGREKTLALKEFTVTLSRGDRLIFYTDGVYDIANRSGDRLERRGFRALLNRQVPQTNGSQDLVEQLRASLETHREQTALLDDITLFAFTF